uniref:Uncharacterized protein n=1 Tax=Rhizophora mucronata TaxID=61149 RepID=A0A2P2QIT9_RHIMU
MALMMLQLWLRQTLDLQWV